MSETLFTALLGSSITLLIGGLAAWSNGNTSSARITGTIIFFLSILFIVGITLEFAGISIVHNTYTTVFIKNLYYIIPFAVIIDIIVVFYFSLTYHPGIVTMEMAMRALDDEVRNRGMVTRESRLSPIISNLIIMSNLIKSIIIPGTINYFLLAPSIGYSYAVLSFALSSLMLLIIIIVVHTISHFY